MACRSNCKTFGNYEIEVLLNNIATIARVPVDLLNSGRQPSLVDDYERPLKSEARQQQAALQSETEDQTTAARSSTRIAGGKRDYRGEREAANLRTTDRILDLSVARHDQTLGEEYIKLAQAMILCTLPHSATRETKITRRARLGDGSILALTFSATTDGVAMPFGADRKLLFWLIDRAIRTDSPFIPWSSAAEYMREVGLGKGGRTNKQLRDRFARVSGLVISIIRKGTETTKLETYPVIARAYLPNSISYTDKEQSDLPGMGDGFGVLLHGPLFADLRKHNMVMPRRLWLNLKGPTPVQDLVFWLYYRCYAAASESVIPWTALTDQFPSGDSNPYRLRQHVRRSIKLLKVLWPEAQVREVPHGIWVDRAAAAMLDDDPIRNRIRRL